MENNLLRSGGYNPLELGKPSRKQPTKTFELLIKSDLSAHHQMLRKWDLQADHDS